MLAMHNPNSVAPSRLLGTPASELKFRVQGGEHHGRMLRIAAAKCSIGSARGCTLRLNGEGIAPLHCLILSGMNGTIVRRNSPQTYLNGGPFDDATLNPGDVLRMGPIELEVVSCPQSVRSATSAETILEVTSSQFEQAAKVEQRISEEVSRARDQEQAAQQQLAQELGLMAQQLRAAQEQVNSTLQLRDQAIQESQEAIEQLRQQYSQGLERFLCQQREERTESQAREQQILEELCLAKQNADELASRLAQEQAAAERQAQDQQQLTERLREDLRGEQALRQQEREELLTTQQTLQDSLSQIQSVLVSQRGEILEGEQSHENVSERIRQLETQLGEARQESQERAREQLAEQQRAQEEFTAVRGRLEVSISLLTEQLQQREAELAASHQRGGECAETLTFALDEARRELRQLQVQRSQEEEQRTSYRMQLEEQLSDLTTQLLEREHLLAQHDNALAELQQRTVHLDTTDQIVKHLEENLATAATTHQTEKESWLADKRRLESQLSDLETMRSEGESRQNALETNCSSLETQRKELETKHSELKAQHAALQSRLEILEAEHGKLQSERNTLQSQYSSLEAQRSEFETQIARAREAAHGREELEEQLANLQSRLEQAIDQEKAQQVAKEEAIHQYELQVERWQSEAHKWQLQAEESASELGPMKQRCAQLESENSTLAATNHSAEVAAVEQQNFENLRTQLEMQRKELAEAQARLQEEQLQLKQLLTDASAREEVLARYEEELRERETAWETARTEQASLLEERSQRIASQIAQFEAEQAAFARQQATIIQQMSTLEDRVHQLTNVTETRSTNSPFVIPRLDDPTLMGDLERAEQPYIREKSQRSSEDCRLEDIQLPEATSDVISEDGVSLEPSVESTSDESDLDPCKLIAAGIWKESAADPELAAEEDVPMPAPEKPRYTPTSFLDQAAEMVRQEELTGAKEQTGNKGFSTEPQAALQSTWKSPAAGKPEDDDSIEEYMSRLLSRVRGSDSAAHATQASQSPQSTPTAVAFSNESAEILEDSAEPKEYVPRAHAPEPPERLSLMRALANTAAKSAIQAHAKKAQKRETKRRSLVALLSLLGATSLFVAGFYTGSTSALVGSLAFMGICCMMSMRAISSSFRQMSLPSPAEAANQPETETNPE